MLVDFIVGLSLAAILLIMLWALKGLLLTPITSGENTSISIELTVCDSEPKLEQTIKGFVWLRDNGTLKANLYIDTHDADAATAHIAEAYAEKYGYITLSKDGETYGRAN